MRSDHNVDHKHAGVAVRGSAKLHWLDNKLPLWIDRFCSHRNSSLATLGFLGVKFANYFQHRAWNKPSRASGIKKHPAWDRRRRFIAAVGRCFLRLAA